MSFSLIGGQVLFTDTNFSADSQEIIKSSLQSAGVTAEISFAGTAGSGPSYSNDNINNFLGQSSSNAGAVLPEADIDNAGSSFKIGFAEGITDSIGVRKVDNASDVSVAAGKKFTLLGDGTTATTAPIALAAGSTLELGHTSSAITEAQGGLLGAINSYSGAINVRKGKFTAESVSGSGSLQVDAIGELVSNAAVTVKNANIAGKLKAANGISSTEAMTVSSGGSLKTTNIVAQGGLNAGGLVQADDIQAGNVNIDTTGVVIVDHLGEKINQNVDNRGTVLTSNMSNKGLLQMSSSSSLVVGDTNIETYYLLHLDLAKTVLENGGTVSNLVKQTLIDKGMLSEQAIALEGQTDEAVAEPEKEPIVTAEETAVTAPATELEAPATVAEDPADALPVIPDRVVPRSVQALASHSSSLYESVRMADQAHRTVLDHVQSIRPVAGSLWAQGVYSKVKTDDFESDTTGFSFGADGTIGETHIGAAFTAQRGDVDSLAENDTESYSFSVYAAKPVSFGMNAAAGLTYTRSTNELSSEGWEGKDKVDTFLLGARLTRPWDLSGGFSVMSYAGLDLGWMKAKAKTVRFAGADSFSLGKTDEWFARMPLGVKASKFIPMGEGTLNAVLDMSVTPQFGAKDTKRAIENVSYVYDFTDDYVASVNLDLSYQGRKGAFSLSYGASQGSIRDLSHSVKAKASLFF